MAPRALVLFSIRRRYTPDDLVPLYRGRIIFVTPLRYYTSMHLTARILVNYVINIHLLDMQIRAPELNCRDILLRSEINLTCTLELLTFILPHPLLHIHQGSLKSLFALVRT